MNKTFFKSLHFDCGDNESRPRDPHPSCVNALEIATILNLNKNYHKKAKLIKHIYNCSICYNEFKEYLSLLDKTEAFCILSKDVLQKHPPSHKRKYPLLIFQPRLLAYTVLTVFFAALIMSRYFSPFDNNTKPITSHTRGLSSSTINVFPKPFSSISREFLYFKWESTEHSLPQGVCLYNSDLELIWESDYSIKGMTSLPNQIKSELIINQQYYWTIRSISESGTAVFSILFPFSIRD